MLYSEIIAVCSETHRKNINTRWGQNVEFWFVKLVVLRGLNEGLESLLNPSVCNVYLSTANYSPATRLEMLSKTTKVLRLLVN
jgi:hypothetical protein